MEVCMKLILNKFKKMDSSILKVKNNGLKFCFMLLLISTFVLSIYLNVHNPALFLVGVSLFKSSLFFIVFFIIKNLFIRQLPVIIDQIEVFPWMKGKVGRKSRRKILIQRIEVHVDSLPQAGINHGVTKEKRKIERFNLPGFQ
mgnify:CR=1 FL=1